MGLMINRKYDENAKRDVRRHFSNSAAFVFAITCTACFLVPQLSIGAKIDVYPGTDAEPDRARQEEYLQQSLKINMKGRGRYPMTTLHDKTWREWQKRTGELPPDFALMPSMPFLPDPLVSREDGTSTPIKTKEQWENKREWIKEQFQYWVSGHRPPAPDNLEAEILEDRIESGTRIQMIELRFGPDHKAKMTFELMVPQDGETHPVYMTQWNHREWAQLAVRRGYIGCVYAGADSKDDTNAYQALYPDYDFSQLMRRAWGASRIVDYLLTRPEVNKDQIAITGHSRNGKQSLWATAFDDRIGAVITSSCGTGGIMPWRYSDPQYCNETIDAICGVANIWFQPRLRYFFGREDKLPTDENEMLSVIAPRPLLMTFSYMEHQSNIWAAEKCYHSVKSVYDFMDEGDNISMFVRVGEHAVAARDVERHIDFLDVQFGRRDIPWDLDLFFDYDFADWKAKHADDVTSASTMEPVKLKNDYASADDFAADKKRIESNLDWLLGDEPPGVKALKIDETRASRIDWHDGITGRPEPRNTKIIHIGPYTSLGEHIPATIYLPVDKDDKPRSVNGSDKPPLIIYLHQYAYAHGYAYGYNPRGGGGGARRVLERMTDQGFAVLAIDMFGFGTRLKEASNFYDRQPGWSKMGKMVSDVSACVDAAQGFDYIDSDHIYIIGDTIGGAVGLMAAARDERIDGVAVVSALSPWRASNDRYPSIRTLAHMHGFMPRLGLFEEAPEQTPVDWGEIVSCIAPRPVMIVAPSLDRHSDPEATAAAMESVSAIYKTMNADGNFQFETPEEINRMVPEIEDNMLNFFEQQVKAEK